MMRLARFLRRLRRDRRGTTIVEFALIAGPMCLILVGGLELAYHSMIRTTMQGALNEAVRRATVENPQFGAYAGDTLEERIENSIHEIVGTLAKGATIDIEQVSFFDFSDIGNPEKLLDDINGNGIYDADDDDCFEDANGNGVYDTDAGTPGRGGANDVVFYRAQVVAPRLLPLPGFLDIPANIELTLETAARNQPYANQATPAVLCGV